MNKYNKMNSHKKQKVRSSIEIPLDAWSAIARFLDIRSHLRIARVSRLHHGHLITDLHAWDKIVAIIETCKSGQNYTNMLEFLSARPCRVFLKERRDRLKRPKWINPPSMEDEMTVVTWPCRIRIQETLQIRFEHVSAAKIPTQYKNLIFGDCVLDYSVFDSFLERDNLDGVGFSVCKLKLNGVMNRWKQRKRLKTLFISVTSIHIMIDFMRIVRFADIANVVIFEIDGNVSILHNRLDSSPYATSDEVTSKWNASEYVTWFPGFDPCLPLVCHCHLKHPTHVSCLAAAWNGYRL